MMATDPTPLERLSKRPEWVWRAGMWCLNGLDQRLILDAYHEAAGAFPGKRGSVLLEHPASVGFGGAR